MGEKFGVDLECTPRSSEEDPRLKTRLVRINDINAEVYNPDQYQRVYDREYIKDIGKDIREWIREEASKGDVTFTFRPPYTRRRMAQREFSSRRDLPVLLRLLEQIQEAQRKANS